MTRREMDEGEKIGRHGREKVRPVAEGAVCLLVQVLREGTSSSRVNQKRQTEILEART